MKKLKNPFFIYSIITTIIILILAYLIYDMRVGNLVEPHIMLLDNYEYGEGKIAPGRYYMDGDRNNFYFEVFDDQTMELGGGDALALLNALLRRPKGEEFSEESSSEWAKYYGGRFNYVAVHASYTHSGFLAKIYQGAMDEAQKRLNFHVGIETKHYIFRECTTVEEILEYGELRKMIIDEQIDYDAEIMTRAEPFAKLVNGNRIFTIWTRAFILLDDE